MAFAIGAATLLIAGLCIAAITRQETDTMSVQDNGEPVQPKPYRFS